MGQIFHPNLQGASHGRVEPSRTLLSATGHCGSIRTVFFPIPCSYPCGHKIFKGFPSLSSQAGVCVCFDILPFLLLDVCQVFIRYCVNIKTIQTFPTSYSLLKKYIRSEGGIKYEGRRRRSGCLHMLFFWKGFGMSE